MIREKIIIKPKGWIKTVKSEEIKNLPSQINTEFKEELTKAYKIQEKQKRTEGIQAALKEATDVPLACAKLCHQVIGLCESAAEKIQYFCRFTRESVQKQGPKPGFLKKTRTGLNIQFVMSKQPSRRTSPSGAESMSRLILMRIR